MIKTSTLCVRSLIKEVVSPLESSEELSDEDLEFYKSIQKDLTMLEQKPKDALIENILHYSRFL